MRFWLVAFFAMFFHSAVALGGITTDAEGNVTFDDGTVVPFDSELIIEGDEDSTSNIFCDIGVFAFSGGAFQNINNARGFCGRFDRFCHVRQFGSNFFEGRFRQRAVFRGRGNNHFNARGNAWNLYLNFLNGNGRNGRFQNIFGHQFGFSNNCSG